MSDRRDDRNVQTSPLGHAEPGCGLHGTRPPWLAVIVGYLFLDGLFGIAGTLLSIPGQGDLLYRLPPFSFFWWYAYGDPWGWARPLTSFLSWTIPLLQLGVAYSIWRTPANTQRLVLIVGAALALAAALQALVPHEHIAHGYVWDMGRSMAGVAGVALAVFAIWFVRRFASLARPEATLLAVYLILTGVSGLCAAISGVVEQGLALPLCLIRGFCSWSYALAECPIVEVLTSALMIGCGVLLRRADPHLRAIGIAVVLGSALNLAMWLLRILAGVWGPFLPDASQHLIRMCPVLGSLAVALALARFLWRNKRLFASNEPLCRSCRYNLKGNVSGVCPECGTPAEVA